MRYKTITNESINEPIIDESSKAEAKVKGEESHIYQEFNYVLSKSQFNPKEVNNCLIDSYLIKKYKLEISNEIIKNEQLKIIFRDKLIYGLISDLINEPLFDKIRTIDKLGYIVKSTLKYHTYLNNSIMFLCYIIQSNYETTDIYKSIDEFNILFYKDFVTNKEKFQNMFETLKKSKLIDLKKNPTDLDEEVMIYLSTIINKYGIFNYDKLNVEILETITFSELTKCIKNLFNVIVKTNRYHVILDKNI